MPRLTWLRAWLLVVLGLSAAGGAVADCPDPNAGMWSDGGSFDGNPNSYFSDPNAAGQSNIQRSIAINHPSCQPQPYFESCTVTTPPAIGVRGVATCHINWCGSENSGPEYADALCSACSNKTGKPAFVGGSVPASGTVCDGSCEIATSQPTLVINGSGKSSPTLYESHYTGNTCSAATPNTTSSGSPQCVSSGGVTSCNDTTSKPNCGTFNGDEVCVTSIPPGTCESFASGGVACTAVSGQPYTTPPAPDNGTTGVPAIPAASVSGTVNGTQETTGYFTANQVAASQNPVQTTAGGQNVGNAGTAPISSGAGGGNGDGKGNAGTSCGNGKTSAGADCVDDAFSGGNDCATPPVCSGDPIQCAQAEQEFLMRCQNPVSTDDVFGTGQTPQASKLQASGEGGDVTTMLDTSSFLSGQCLQDKVLNLGSWGTITLPLAQFCWVFQALGVMVMTCAWIGAAKIVVGVNK